MKPIKILICEDDHLLAVDLENRITKLGHVVVGALTKGEEVLEKIEKLSPDLVLMDIGLDGKMTGIETAEILFSTYFIPSIFITALQDEITIERARKSKPLGYLVKPVNDRDLQMTIEFGFSHYRLEKTMQKKLDDYKEFLQDIGYVDDDVSQPYFSVAHSKPNIQAISRILGKLAHCISEASETVHVHLDWLLNCNTIGEFERRQVEAAIKGYNKQRSIMEQLLWASQLSSRTFMPAHLYELVNVAIEQVRPYLSDRITLNTVSNIDVDNLYVDREAIVLAIVNLLRNAIEAIPGEGNISVSLSQEQQDFPETHNPLSVPGAYFVISINDDGRGFSYGVADKVFEPFFTTHESTNSVGLGLSAAFGIMQAHGGWITLESEKDKGSTFRLYLPPSEELTVKGKETAGDGVSNALVL